MTTYDEASERPVPDVLNRYQALNDRDAMAVAIATLKARGTFQPNEHVNDDRFPPLAAAEQLELLALGEVLARHFAHPAHVHHAVLAGATWEQIAAAAGGDADRTREAYRVWAEGQHQLRRDFPGGTIGLGDEEYAAALEAAGEPGPAAAACTPAEDARRLDAIRAVLAGFSWETGNRQYALEKIERIADGGGP